jgi:hypothetical protein
MSPRFAGCLPAYSNLLDFYFLIPAQGYTSLQGVHHALLHAVNFDRVQRGLQPLEADALDASYLTTIPKADWMFPELRAYLAFVI